MENLPHQDTSLVLETISTLSTDPDWSRRVSAANFLGDKRAVKAVEALIEALKDEEPQVRQAAAEALGFIEDARAIPHLIEAFKNNHPIVCYEISDAFLHFGEAGISALTSALLNENDNIRYWAVRTWGHLGDPRGIPFLKKVMLNDQGQTEWGSVREAARASLNIIRRDTGPLRPLS